LLATDAACLYAVSRAQHEDGRLEKEVSDWDAEDSSEEEVSDWDAEASSEEDDTDSEDDGADSVSLLACLLGRKRAI
jgi:hypothetical protein